MWGLAGLKQAARGPRFCAARHRQFLVMLRRRGGPMVISVYLMWWIAAAALVAAELVTGTFYLLVIGAALACAGVAALGGASVAMQWLTAGVLGIVGTLLLQRWKRSLAGSVPAQANLDIGQMVRVQSWGPGGT